MCETLPTVEEEMLFGAASRAFSADTSWHKTSSGVVVENKFHVVCQNLAKVHSSRIALDHLDPTLTFLSSSELFSWLER